MSQQSKVAIITGASRGIGAAIAKRLAADGFQVVVNYVSDEKSADDVVASISDAGGIATAIRANVSKVTEVKALFDEAERSFDHADVVINNAGITCVGPLKDVTDEDFQRLVAINFTGAFNVMREAANRLLDGGRIINISSGIVGTCVPDTSVYGATKSAVETMTRILAKELGPRNIAVNAIAPGPTATELFYNSFSKERIEQLIKDIPMGRIGTPEDIANVVSFLAGPTSGWVSGQIVNANGGRN